MVVVFILGFGAGIFAGELLTLLLVASSEGKGRDTDDEE